MSLLSPWALAWAAAAAAILGLYFLKPRSRRVEVSSTWLWQGVLREESARSPLQWLKRHLLLLLQLLIALLAMFALARPALNQLLPVGRTVVLGMDVSAAMLANDGDPAAGAPAGAPAPARAAGQTYTRLDEARARAIAFLRGPEFRAGDRVIVMRLADRAEVVAQGTLPDDLPRLQAAVGGLRAVAAELDLSQGLEVAGGLTSTARVGQLVLFTGGVADPERVTRPPELNISVIPVGKGEADNQAVTALAARRTAAGDLEVFVRVRNFGDQPAQGTLQLRVDGQAAQPQPVALPAGGSQPLVLTEFPTTASVIEATFVRDPPDLLLLDNQATAAVTVPPLRKVLLVGGRSDQLERALKAVPGVELTKTDPQRYETSAGGRSGGYDVYVFEGWFPPAPPPGHWLLIDPPSSQSPVRVEGALGRRTDGAREVNDAQIVRVLPSPLLQGVDLTGVGVQEAKKVDLPDWAEEVVAARTGPLIFMGYPRPYRAAVFAFDLRPPTTNLFGRVGFPVLIANTINWLSGEGTDGGEQTPGEGRFTPGDALLIQPLPRATRVEIQTPARRSYRFDGNQPVRFVDTERPGAYTVTQYAGDLEIVRRVYVASVLRPGREDALANLQPRAEVAALSTTAGAQAQPPVFGPGRETNFAEWWRLLGVLALVGLLAEWWWFHR